MEIAELENFIKSKNIKTIPSEFWRLKEPDAYVLAEPFDFGVFEKKYQSSIIDKKETFNITFLFHKEEYHNSGDIVHLCRFLFSSGYTAKYNVVFKFNYDPGKDLVKTFGIAKIKYIGHLESQDEYFGLLQNSHVIVSNHRTNYSGTYIAEAALFGIPLIVSPTGGSMHFLNQQNTTFLKTKNNEGSENFVPCQECYGGIFGMIETSYSTLLRLAQRARLTARRMYSKEKYKETLLQIKDNIEV